MELRMQYARAADGVKIAYGVAGSGPTVVRVPSIPFSNCQAEWAQDGGFYHGLTDRFKVVTFDPRGCGLSDTSVDDLSMAARESDIEAVLGRAGVERFALHAVGWSGPLCIRYAVEHPERVTHLILDDTHARVEDFMATPQIRALDALSTGEWDTFLEFLVFTSYGLGRDQAGPHVAYLKSCVTADMARRIFAEVRKDDVTGLLGQVTVPTLILQHAGISKQQVDSAKEMAASIPGATLVMLEGQATDDTDQILRAMDSLLGTKPDHDHHPEAATPAPAATASVRAVLFTDLVGHTEMMSRLGDHKGREVLREHEQITREVLTRHNGTEVKTMGDGFMASFSSVTQAVECAIAMQRAFAERNSRASEPLSIRVGLNAGEPIEEDGDLFGWTVIMASRVAAKAEAGEILASDVVRGLCSGKGFLFADRGEYVLKGFEEPVRVYEVGWRG
ncbi:MAG TPA: adenylate/guanylate cyclase domain-containing protein [Dehalococcoidia bacterium]|jgi:class 3 adenylate cyclase|nr:adenylate/guanylate cyclase domain-containing protein [Dehalococcoidia bacterium]